MLDKPLIDFYQQCLPIYLKKEGFPRPPLLALHHDGRYTVTIMDLPGQVIYQAALERLADLTIKEMVFGIDRFTKPGQGTKYADVLTVFWWQGGERTENHGFRFGVVNYRPPPNPIIEPIDWNNKFWNDIMGKIVEEYHEHMMKRIRAAQQAGVLTDELSDMVREAKERVLRGDKPW